MNYPNKDCSDAEDGEEDRKMKKDKVLMESQEVEIAQFMCPYHACHTCTPSDKVRNLSKLLLAFILLCFLLIVRDCFEVSCRDEEMLSVVTLCHILSCHVTSHHITALGLLNQNEDMTTPHTPSQLLSYH